MLETRPVVALHDQPGNMFPRKMKKIPQDCQTHTLTDRQTYRLNDRQTDIDRQTDATFVKVTVRDDL